MPGPTAVDLAVAHGLAGNIELAGDLAAGRILEVAVPTEPLGVHADQAADPLLGHVFPEEVGHVGRHGFAGVQFGEHGGGLDAGFAVERRLPLVVEKLATFGGLHFIEAAHQRLFFAGELGAEDAGVLLGHVEGHGLELVPGLRRLADAQVGAIVHARDVEVAGHDPDMAIALGGVDQAGDEVGQILLAEPVVDRLEAIEFDVLREEAAVIPADVVVHGAGREVLHQALVGLEAVALEHELDFGAGLLLPGGDEFVQLVVVGAGDGVHAQGLAIEGLADHGRGLGGSGRGSWGGCGGCRGRAGGGYDGRTGGDACESQEFAAGNFLLFRHGSLSFLMRLKGWNKDSMVDKRGYSSSSLPPVCGIVVIGN